MKKLLLVVLTLSISITAFGQKNEIKALEKAINKKDYAAAMAAVTAAESKLSNADAKSKAKFYFFKAQALAGKGSLVDAGSTFKKLLDFEKTSNMNKYTALAKPLFNKVVGDLVNSAIADSDNKSFGTASEKLFSAYNLGGNEEYLYFAADYAVQNKDMKSALKYYELLRTANYTGVVTQFTAVNNESKEAETFPSKALRDAAIKSKAYASPSETKTESRFPGIIKNIALIYSQNGQTDKALKAIKEARIASPNDVSLLLTEADMYIKSGDKDKFQNLMQEAIKKDPNNAVLYFNLGILSSEQGEASKAEGYYKQAIEKDPNYTDAYISLAALILKGESKIVDQMNSLGGSAADARKYTELEKTRENLYSKALPYLEKALTLKPNQIDVLKTLKNIYSNNEDDVNYNKVKSKLKELQN